MPTPENITLQVARNGGGQQTGAVTAAYGDSCVLSLQDPSGVKKVRYEIYDFPEGWSLPAGWSADASGFYYYVSPNGGAAPAFTLPGSILWGDFMLRATANDAIRNEAYAPDLIDDRTALRIASPQGLPDIAYLTGKQFDTQRGWVGALKEWLRALANTSPTFNDNWATVLGNGTDSGPYNPRITTGQYFDFQSEVSVRRQTVAILDTTSTETKLHAPSGGTISLLDGSTQFATLGVLFGVASSLIFSEAYEGLIGATDQTGNAPGKHITFRAGAGGPGGDNAGGNLYYDAGTPNASGAHGQHIFRDGNGVTRMLVDVDRNVNFYGATAVLINAEEEDIALFELDPVNGPGSRRVVLSAAGGSSYFHLIGKQPATNIAGSDVGLIGADGGPGGGSANGGDAFLQGGKKNASGAGGASQLRDPDGTVRVSVEGGDDRNVILDGELLVDIKVGGNSIANATANGLNTGRLNGVAGPNSDNLALHGDPSGWNSGRKVIFVGNSVAIPTAGDTLGFYMYGVSGAAKIKGGSGTETTVAAAEPHCPTCGNDFVHEWRNEQTGKHLAICMWCATDGVPLNECAFVREAA